MRLSFSIPGRPRGKQRPRVAPGQSRPYTPKETVIAEREIRQIFTERFPDHQPFMGPVMIRWTAVFEIPKGWPAATRAACLAGGVYAICKPDKDNIEKLILDAISEDPKTGRRIAWWDDAQVQGGGIKRYGTNERVDVTLEFLDTPAHHASPSQRKREAMPDEQRSIPKKRQSKKSKPATAPLTELERRIADAVARDDAKAPRRAKPDAETPLQRRIREALERGGR